MIYLLTVKEILILSNNIHLFTKSIIIRGNYILKQNYIHFKEPYQFVQGNISSFNEIYPFKKIYLFKEQIFVQVQGHMFIQGNYIEYCCIRGIAEIFIQKLSQPLYGNYKLYNYYLLNKV